MAILSSSQNKWIPATDKLAIGKKSFLVSLKSSLPRVWSGASASPGSLVEMQSLIWIIGLQGSESAFQQDRQGDSSAHQHLGSNASTSEQGRLYEIKQLTKGKCSWKIHIWFLVSAMLQTELKSFFPSQNRDAG